MQRLQISFLLLVYLQPHVTRCQKATIKSSAVECPDVVCTPIPEHCEVPKTFYMNNIPCEDCPSNNCEDKEEENPCPTLMCDHDPFPLNCEQETYFINKDGIRCKGCPENGCLIKRGKSLSRSGSSVQKSAGSSQSFRITSPATSVWSIRVPFSTAVFNSNTTLSSSRPTTGQQSRFFASLTPAITLMPQQELQAISHTYRDSRFTLHTIYRNKSTGKVTLRTRQPIIVIKNKLSPVIPQATNSRKSKTDSFKQESDSHLNRKRFHMSRRKPKLNSLRQVNPHHVSFKRQNTKNHPLSQNTIFSMPYMMWYLMPSTHAPTYPQQMVRLMLHTQRYKPSPLLRYMVPFQNSKFRHQFRRLSNVVSNI